MWYDRNGVPISTGEWAALNLDREYSQIARTTIMDGSNPSLVWEVSTVWLGLDHSFGFGPPAIFETMVFHEGSPLNESCERYATWTEAELGHYAMVSTVAATVVDPIVMNPESIES